MAKLPAIKWVLSCGSALLGAVYYAAWVFGCTWLTQPSHGGATVKPITAALLVLSGLALNILPCARSKLSPIRVQISACFAATILAIVVGAFLDAATSYRVGISRLFVSETGPAPHSVVPGAPSLATLAAFLLIPVAVAVWNYSTTPMIRTVRALGVAVMAISVGAFAQVLVGTNPYEIEGVSSAMALPTAFGLLLLGLDIVLFSRAAKRVMRDTKCASWADAHAKEEVRRTHHDLCTVDS